MHDQNTAENVVNLNSRDHQAVAPTAEILPPQKFHVGALSRGRNVRQVHGRLLRAVISGKLDSLEGQRLSNMLKNHSDLLREEDFAERLARIEAVLEGRTEP